ncbi:agmatinase [Nitrospirillum viridazoti]|uniref:Agmatinase n=1 Tax=Nitrospirillum viridazoti CBAmc TaxID=1441467 RepID=A0A248JUR8_9PROT|nr:agmatinase [Nitrospirillum amazonense]ASG22266.1 agmatinase [Nitrospirillum amazonense CBAmc]TWB30966.1 agmatinase [Nitrospirillum amazonense]
MDQTKLDRLRQRYGAASPADFFDPHFRDVAEAVFRGAEAPRQPFADAGTLLDAPLRPDLAALDDFGGLDIALVGVPMDLGVTNRAGSRFGPRAVRGMDRIGPYEHVLRLVPSAQASIADIGDVPFSNYLSLVACHHDIQTFYGRLAAAGVVPLSVGGDHSVSYSILKALGRDRPVGMIHFDAHCDTSGSDDSARFHHSGPFRLAVLDGVLDPDRTIQIGIRGSAEFFWEFSYDAGMTVLHAEDVAEMGVKAVIAKAREVVGDGPVYISFDVDCLDPVYAPGTGTPEVGGLTSREALAILRGLAGLDVVGADVVEIAPQYDPTSNTAQIGAQILFEQLCLATLALDRRRQRG